MYIQNDSCLLSDSLSGMYTTVFYRLAIIRLSALVQQLTIIIQLPIINYYEAISYYYAILATIIRLLVLMCAVCARFSSPLWLQTWSSAENRTTRQYFWTQIAGYKIRFRSFRLDFRNHHVVPRIIHNSEKCYLLFRRRHRRQVIK